jgi:hypothetical protein
MYQSGVAWCQVLWDPLRVCEAQQQFEAHLLVHRTPHNYRICLDTGATIGVARREVCGSAGGARSSSLLRAAPAARVYGTIPSKKEVDHRHARRHLPSRSMRSGLQIQHPRRSRFASALLSDCSVYPQGQHHDVQVCLCCARLFQAVLFYVLFVLSDDSKSASAVVQLTRWHDDLNVQERKISQTNYHRLQKKPHAGFR